MNNSFLLSSLLFIIKIIFLVNFFILNQGYSKGDLTKQNPIEIVVFLKGEVGKNHLYDPSLLRFETGKLYKLKLINISDSKHYFSSANFVKSIFTRKVQVVKNEKKIAEIKGIINEVEIFPKNILEWWFVPIKTGKFNDLFCHIKDLKLGVTHAEMGMTGTIIIE